MTYLNLFHLVTNSDSSKTNRFSTSFFPLAVQALSKQKGFFANPKQTHIPLYEKKFSVYILS